MILEDIRTEARSLLAGRWVNLVPIWFVYFMVMMVPGLILKEGDKIIQFGISLAIGGPFAYAVARISTLVRHQHEVEIKHLFEGFNDFTRLFIANLLITLYIVIGMILLIVPGIIAGLNYSMTYYILAENPNIGPKEAMNRSKQLMLGHKSELCILSLSFFGWALLSILTAGIGLLWLQSYMTTSFAIFYNNIKGRAPRKEEVIHITDKPAPFEDDSIS